MAYIFSTHNPNLWLGTPRTAVGVVPVTAGLRYGGGSGRGEEAQGSQGTLRLGTAILVNESGNSGVTMGLTRLLPDSQWIAGQWVNATTTFTADTTDAQDAGVDDFALFTTTANSGFMVQCAEPFDMLSVDVTTAVVGAGIIPIYSYWGTPLIGTGTTAFCNVAVDNGPTWTTTGEKVVNLSLPVNHMVALAAGDFTGARPGWYAVLVRAQTAPATSGGSAARIYVGKKLYQQQGVADSGAVNPNPAGSPGSRLIRGGVALGSFFSSAHSDNFLYLEVA